MTSPGEAQEDDTMRALRIWDISEALGESTATWPGDTPFSREWVMRLDAGHSCSVSTIRTSVHNGTHGDAPSHFLEDAPTIDEVGLDAYLGPCRVVHVTPTADGFVPESAFDALDGVTRVLFRTSETHDADTFDEAFCALGERAAQRAVDLGLRLVGLDTPSIDHCTSKTMGGHKILLGGGIAILENLDLTAVLEGDYELIALPLKIRGGDAAPIRAVLRELPPGR